MRLAEVEATEPEASGTAGILYFKAYQCLVCKLHHGAHEYLSEGDGTNLFLVSATVIYFNAECKL